MQPQHDTDKRMGKAGSFVLALAIAVPLSVVVFLLVYATVVTYNIPRTVDGHPVMPVGQVLASIVIAFISGMIMLYFLYKFIRDGSGKK